MASSQIAVYNSRTIRADSLIGSFYLDTAFVYEQEQHTISRKWVMLSNPKDRATGVMGFVKLTVNVIGPGDAVPVSLQAVEPPPTVCKCTLMCSPVLRRK